MGAKNDECRKCETPKPSEGLVQKNSRSQVKPGDWICPSCGDHQFARNDECKQCSAAKPDGVVVAKAEMKPVWRKEACRDRKEANCSRQGWRQSGQKGYEGKAVLIALSFHRILGTISDLRSGCVLHSCAGTN